MVMIFVYVNTPYTDFLSNGLRVVLDIFKYRGSLCADLV